MAKRSNSPKRSNKPVAKTAAKPASKRVSSPVRNTALPKPQPETPVRREITGEMIARRAHEIYLSGQGGSELDHWLQAEREMRGA